MADEVSFFIVLVKIIAIALGGLITGKIVYRIVHATAKMLTQKTKTTLDDYILQYIEGPLGAAMVVFFIYVFSGILVELTGLRALMSNYSLAILAVLAGYTLSELVGGVLRWMYVEGTANPKMKVDVTLLPFARKVSSVLIMFFAITTALAIVGLDVGGLLAITSVVALVLGLASQETLGNIFAGLALQLDRPFAYNEFLRLPSGETVRLRKIGLRSTKLDDLHGSTMILSNSELAKLRVTNLSRPGREFKIDIAIELPKGVALAAFEKHILAALEEKESNANKGTGKITVEKVSKDAITVKVSFFVPDFEEANTARDFVNRKAIEFLSKKSTP